MFSSIEEFLAFWDSLTVIEVKRMLYLSTDLRYLKRDVSRAKSSWDDKDWSKIRDQLQRENLRNENVVEISLFSFKEIEFIWDKSVGQLCKFLYFCQLQNNSESYSFKFSSRRKCKRPMCPVIPELHFFIQFLLRGCSVLRNESQIHIEPISVTATQIIIN